MRIKILILGITDCKGLSISTDLSMGKYHIFNGLLQRSRNAIYVLLNLFMLLKNNQVVHVTCYFLGKPTFFSFFVLSCNLSYMVESLSTIDQQYINGAFCFQFVFLPAMKTIYRGARGG